MKTNSPLKTGPLSDLAAEKFSARLAQLNNKYSGVQQHSNIGTFGINHAETIRFNSTPNNNWEAFDWLQWHKLLVQAFKDGRFKSGIRYTPEKATELANAVFMSHWNKAASFGVKNFAGYKSDFFNYFNSVGLSDILSVFQAIVNPVAGGVVNVAKSSGNVLTSVGKTGESLGKGLSFTGKLIPIAIVVAVLIAGYIAYKKFS